MAFEIKNLALTSTGLANTPNIWSYNAPFPDLLQDVLVADYFTPAFKQFQDGDRLFVYSINSGDSAIFSVIKSVGPDSITIEQPANSGLKIDTFNIQYNDASAATTYSMVMPEGATLVNIDAVNSAAMPIGGTFDVKINGGAPISSIVFPAATPALTVIPGNIADTPIGGGDILTVELAVPADAVNVTFTVFLEYNIF